VDAHSPKALNATEWREKLKKIAENLENTTHLTLVGSGANMLEGQPMRTSLDLDVWKPTSKYHPQDLATAVKKAGLLFNPTTENPSKPYIQMLDPDICQLGPFTPKPLLALKNKLHIEIPPIANRIASKLKRANPQDLQDIQWLLSHSQTQKQNLSPEELEKIIEKFPHAYREATKENLILLEILLQHPKKSTKTGEKSQKSKTQPQEQGPVLP
jgi:hypothetical protein